MKKRFILMLFVAIFLANTARAQKTENVHGVYTYVVNDNDRLTLIEIKQKATVGAQSEAIKEKFKETITARTNMVDSNINGEDCSQFVEEIEASSAAEWLGDVKPTAYSASYSDGKLYFTAEVWGEARELSHAKTDLKWKILCKGTTDDCQSNRFDSGDRLFIKFKSPASGYLAIYALVSTSKRASCLLPYRGSQTGYFKVEAGKEYILFDPQTDPQAPRYIETTKKGLEMDKIVLIYSPNKFTKCTDSYTDSSHSTSVSITDFNNWLHDLRKHDKELEVDNSQWIHIVGK